MKLRDAIILVTLGLLFGASFLATRVAVPEFGAFALIGLRVALAAAFLLPLVLVRRQWRDVAAHWRSIALVGVLQYAAPFCLYAYAMLTLSAGYSSLVNASAPLFAGVIARLWLGERLDASRTAGLVLGLAGVALLVGDKLAMAGAQDAIAVAATLLAAFCYGFAAVLAKRQLAGVSPTAVAGGSMSAAAIVLMPLSAFLWPDAPPSTNAWAMVALLGVICTALAFVLYFRLIDSIGPTKSITVTFLIPLFAVAFGALFLDEKVTASMVAGGAVIIIGTALATGLVSFSVLLKKSRVFATRTAIVVVAVSALDDIPPDIHAAELDTALHVAVNSFSYESNDGWNSFETLALTGELEREIASQSMVTGLFAEYHASNDASVDGTIFAGMRVGHRGRLWDNTAYLFTSRFPGTASRTTFKVRFRRGLRDGARIGIEYMAGTDSLESGELKFGFYQSISSTVSMKFLAGTVFVDDSPLMAQLQFAWRLH